MENTKKKSLYDYCENNYDLDEVKKSNTDPDDTCEIIKLDVPFFVITDKDNTDYTVLISNLSIAGGDDYSTMTLYFCRTYRDFYSVSGALKRTLKACIADNCSPDIKSLEAKIDKLEKMIECMPFIGKGFMEAFQEEFEKK